MARAYLGRDKDQDGWGSVKQVVVIWGDGDNGAEMQFLEVCYPEYTWTRSYNVLHLEEVQAPSYKLADLD